MPPSLPYKFEKGTWDKSLKHGGTNLKYCSLLLKNVVYLINQAPRKLMLVCQNLQSIVLWLWLLSFLFLSVFYFHLVTYPLLVISCHDQKFCHAFFRCFSCSYSDKASQCFHFFAISSANKRSGVSLNGMHLRQGANIFISS